ncbi:ASCH domain-containing protein [Kaistia sp. MMO-174]|uniref:ASCH domain-containing protein n=1 Tax=Kaistia sp. MMO-174 TaxID=3081256 RepID=UPI003019A82B
MNAKPRRLTLAVKGEYFDQIACGEKPEEYRLVTAYWTKRLVGRAYDEVEITRGYPPAGDQSRRLVFPWRGYACRQITHPHFGSSPVDVFAIRVGSADAITE